MVGDKEAWMMDGARSRSALRSPQQAPYKAHRGIILEHVEKQLGVRVKEGGSSTRRWIGASFGGGYILRTFVVVARRAWQCVMVSRWRVHHYGGT